MTNRIAFAAVLLPAAFLVAILLLRHSPRTLGTTPPPPASASAAIESPPASGVIQGVATIIDGDTIEVAKTRIRLEGIDAPEGSQTCSRGSTDFRCGGSATQALRALAGGKDLRCIPSGRDQFKRVLATCVLISSGLDIGGWMVSQGYAFAFVRYSRKYVAVQEEAANANRGFWSGTFEYPWEYRARLRAGSTK